jgi:hypothetical protein
LFLCHRADTNCCFVFFCFFFFGFFSRLDMPPILGDYPNKKKKTGSTLSMAEEEAELAAINPFARRPSVLPRVLPTLKSYVRSGQTGGTSEAAVEIGTDDEAEEVGTEEGTCSNSTTHFGFHHFSFVYEDDSRIPYVCVVVHIPTGMEKGGLSGKLQAKVSPCGKKLVVKMEWPSVFYSSSWLIESIQAKICNKVPNVESFKSTMYNLRHAFKREVDCIREKNDIEFDAAIGGTYSMPLPFQCETQIFTSTTTSDARTGTCVLTAILKKKEQKDREGCDLDINKIGSGPVHDMYGISFSD